MKTREQVLELLASRGYNTFSELPGFSTIYKNGELQVDTTEISHLMKEARRLNFKKVFTYGGGFLGSLKIDSASVHGLSPKGFTAPGEGVEKRSIVEKWLPIVVNFSDEAAGYSMQVERDLKRAKILEKYYPYLSNGGFTHSIEKGKYGYDLNQRFIEPSYSSVAPPEDLGAKKQWGLYNQIVAICEKPFGFWTGIVLSSQLSVCGHLCNGT